VAGQRWLRSRVARLLARLWPLAARTLQAVQRRRRSGTSYCQDYGTLPTPPASYTAAATLTAVASPAGGTGAATALAANVALTGGVSLLVLSWLWLGGTLPAQLRELLITTAILLSRNALTARCPPPGAKWLKRAGESHTDATPATPVA